MPFKKLLSFFSCSSKLESFSSQTRPFSFTAAIEWENASDDDRFSLMSPDADGILTELMLKEQPTTETLEEANERVNYFNNRIQDNDFGTPQKVSGPGWQGLLQSQIMRDGGHEFQLVAKTSSQTLVFYLASPPGVDNEQLNQLKQVILSLSVNA